MRVSELGFTMPYARSRLKKKGTTVSLKQNNLLKYRRNTHAQGKLNVAIREFAQPIGHLG